MRVTFEPQSSTFIAITAYDERGIPKSAGFQWDGAAKRWQTRSPAKAARLEKYADARAKRALLESKDTPAASLEYNAGRKRFEFLSEYDPDMVRIARAAGLQFDGRTMVWHSSDPAAAARLVKYATPQCAEMISGIVQQHAENIESSRATSSDVELPVPAGLDYLPYQRAGIASAITRRNVYFGDEMGLGKTIQAIGVFNADPEARTMLVIAPASLKINWQREVEKWATKDVKVGRANGKTFPDDSHNVVVINYENVAKQRDAIDARTWDILVCDESQYLKSHKAQRTKAILGDRVSGDRGIRARRTVMMSGTPIMNCPIELWTTVQRLDPNGLGSDFMGFAKRYCNGKRTRFGWDFTGSSNLAELQDRLRAGIMIRRTKDQVLTELPAKIRQVIALEPDRSTQKLIERQHGAADRVDRLKAEIAARRAAGGDYASDVGRLKEGQSAAFTEIARLRHEIAVAKIPAVIDHIKQSQDGGSKKIIVFAHHRDVVDAIQAEFGEAAVSITGETPQDKRQKAVDRFQTDPACTVFVGNMRAAGVGLTLTASSHVVMAELDWTPAAVAQAEDRAHRIGQKDSVLVQHLVFDGSLDAQMARTIVEKQNIADRALDTRDPASVQASADQARQAVEAAMLALSQRAPADEQAAHDAIAQAEQEAAESMEARAVWEEKNREAMASITPEQMAAVHQNLRSLAMVCNYAVVDDGTGFNKIDAKFGHDLANKETLSPAQAVAARNMVVKYKGQLGDAAVDAMFGQGMVVVEAGRADTLAALERQTGLTPADAKPLSAGKRD